MSGLSKGSKKFLSMMFFFFYFSLLIALLWVGFQFPKQITAQQETHVESVLETMETIFDDIDKANENQRQMIAKKSGKELVDSVHVDIAIQDAVTKTILYSNMADDVIKDFATESSEAVLYKSQDIYFGNQGTELLFSVVIYEISVFPLFYQTITVLVILAVLLSICTIFGTQSLEASTIVPLKKLKVIITDLAKFDFNSILNKNSEMTNKDALSLSLQQFTADLKYKMDQIGEDYTGLEMELQSRIEYNEYIQLLVAALVHDLKTPLNISMVHLGNFARKHEYTENELQELIENVSLENDRMLVEINELLTVLSSEEQLDPVAERFNAIQVFQKIMNTYQKPLSSRSIIVDLEVAPHLEVMMNKLEFTLILNNLISNAEKYVEDNGEIAARIFEEEGNLQIEIENSTLAETIDFQKVFNLFYSDDQTGSTKSGVGLYMVKQMITKNGGEIIFEPSKLGVLVSVSLPVVVS